MSTSRSPAPLGQDAENRFSLDWNGPVDRPFAPFSDESKDRPILELLHTVVARHPQRIAILDAESSLTYSELWRLVGDWANPIANLTAPGELIGVIAPTSMQLATAVLACLGAGRAFVAIDPHHPRDWIAQALKQANPALLLTMDSSQRVVATRCGAEQSFDINPTHRASRNWQWVRMSSDEPACVLFTSGSTGVPKGIVNSQRNLLQRVAQSINAAHINSEDRFLTLAPLSSIVGVRDLLTALLSGASSFLIDSHKNGAGDILRVIRDYRVSILFSFPALLRSVLQGNPERAGDHLRVVRLGGDTTFASDIELLRGWLPPASFIQLIYAATEAPMMQWFVDRVDHSQDGRMPIGYALPDNTLAVLDDAGAPTRDMEVGELVVCSPYVALGTWSQGRCVADFVCVDPANPRQRTWRSGDMVRRRPDGFYERVGRRDRQLKIRGTRVELDGVEAAIRRHPDVRDVAVIDRSGAENELRLIAYVEPRESASDGFLDNLREMMCESVPPPMRPSRFYPIASLPRLPNSKPDLQAVRTMDQERIRQLQVAASLSNEINRVVHCPLQDVVARTWCAALRVESVDADDDFFRLGGDSLSAIAMIVQLEKAMKREIPLTLINQASTLGAFTAALRNNQSTLYAPLVVIKPGNEVPPLFVVHGLGGSVMELFTLGRQMHWPGAVVGIQARGLNAGDAPHRSVEEMAVEYVAAVKARQPTGPYLLCGFSFGGLVAFDMARRLRSAGDDVAFVGLIDTLPPGQHRLRVWAWTTYLCRRLVQIFHRKRNSGVVKTRTRWVAARALWSSIRYRPDRYEGAVTIFEASPRSLGASLARRWKEYARVLHRHTLIGRHADILHGPSATHFADVLTQCLENALGGARDRHIPMDIVSRHARRIAEAEL